MSHKGRVSRGCQDRIASAKQNPSPSQPTKVASARKREEKRFLEDRLSELYSCGVNLVLCNSDKTPAWSGWNVRRAGIDKVIDNFRAGGMTGWIPASKDLCVVDVDDGNWEILAKEYPPICEYKSRREAGRHLLYYRNRQILDSRFEWKGLEGDIKCPGLVVLHHVEAMSQLVLAMKHESKFRHHPLPRCLVKKKPMCSTSKKKVKKKPTCSTSKKSTSKKSTIPPQLDLEQVKIGGRNSALFAVSGHFLSQQTRPETLGQWVAMALNFDRHQNERFPNPLEDNEVVGIARKSAEYYFPLAPIRREGCDIEKQRQRGIRSGKVRREKNVNLIRNLMIMDDIKVGHPIEKIADFFEISPSQVYQIIEENRTKMGPRNDSLASAHRALRNEAIINDYRSGFEISKLVENYGLSKRSIYKIIAEKPKKTQKITQKKSALVFLTELPDKQRRNA